MSASPTNIEKVSHSAPVPANQKAGMSLDIKLDPKTPVHFVGVGGVGMSGLAILLCESGYQVSGSDLADNAYTRKLQEKGATIYQGHETNHVPSNALVIVSSSIDPTNPELAVAMKQKLPIAHRSTLLREIVKTYKKPIGITGTHGKTTITGMTGLALRAAGLDPGIIVGGKLPHLETNAVSGAKSLTYVVAELDESDGTLLQYQPALSVIANIELDHADFYQDGLEGFKAAFNTYIGALHPGSQVFYNVDCPNTQSLLKQNPSNVEAILLSGETPFSGQETQTTYHLQNAKAGAHGRYSGDVYKNNKLLGSMTVGVPGKHNLLNALCAIAVGDQLGADFNAMAESLKAFTGMGRRFEILKNAPKDILFVDDYGHHPSEVKATLKACKEALAGTSGRVICIFQPHRYTRLKALWDEFVPCFEDADHLIMADVYAAHEPVIPNITSESLTQTILKTQPNSTQKVEFIPNAKENDIFASIRDRLNAIMKPGDLVISMGAGSITSLLRNWQG
jgi:UDP-N-acetylmuramate--alanine ligase